MDFVIKKNQIAINAADARTSRFTGGERIDCAIADIDLNKRKVNLSIKLLEELEKKEALEKYGSEGSGKNLPFSSLVKDLDKKKKKIIKKNKIGYCKIKAFKTIIKKLSKFFKKRFRKIYKYNFKSEIKKSLKKRRKS